MEIILTIWIKINKNKIRKIKIKEILTIILTKIIWSKTIFRIKIIAAIILLNKLIWIICLTCNCSQWNLNEFILSNAFFFLFFYDSSIIFIFFLKTC